MSILVACIMYNKWQNNTKERHRRKGRGERQNTAKPEREREGTGQSTKAEEINSFEPKVDEHSERHMPVLTHTHTYVLPARHPVKCAKYFDIKPDVK